MGTVGLGVSALIFGSLPPMVFPISTGVFVIVMLGVGLLFAGISHLVYGFGNKGSPAWVRGFSIGAGALVCDFVIPGNGISLRGGSGSFCLCRNSTVNNRYRDYCSWDDG